MSKTLIISFILFLLLCFIFAIYAFSVIKLTRSKRINSKTGVNKVYTKEYPGNMKITSSAFTDNSKIPSKYTCDGTNNNPPLTIADVPQGTKSLVLIVDDPDAPNAPNGAWHHWSVFNIPPTVTHIDESSIPTGALEGVTDFQKPGYGGPCPPSGTHHYFFRLSALDIMLPLQQGATLQEINDQMKGHILDQAELIGLYSRS